MKQVFISEICHVDQIISLDDQQAHHLFDVLRVKTNEQIRVVTNTHQVFLAHPLQKPDLQLVEEINVDQDEKEITLCVSLIKQDKFEWMLQKACELGVTRIVPFTSKYSVVQIDAKKESKKLERWSKIIFDACKQCNRNDLVSITPIQTLSTLEKYKSQCNLVAYEKEELDHHFSKYLLDDPKSITVCLGPEGGFAHEEIVDLQASGFQTCSLGSRILRAETAACYVLTSIDYQRYIKKEFA